MCWTPEARLPCRGRTRWPSCATWAPPSPTLTRAASYTETSIRKTSSSPMMVRCGSWISARRTNYCGMPVCRRVLPSPLQAMPAASCSKVSSPTHGTICSHLHASPICCWRASTLSPGARPSKRARGAYALPARRDSPAGNGGSSAKAFVGNATAVLRMYKNGWTNSASPPLRRAFRLCPC